MSLRRRADGPRLTLGAVTASALLAAMPACLTPDALMRLSIAPSQSEADAAAVRLVEVARDDSYDLSRRAWALRSLARLGRAPQAAVLALGDLAIGGHTPSELRAWAAYALGELRQKEALPFLAALLERDSDGENDKDKESEGGGRTHELALDGLCKALPIILADPQWQGRIVALLATYAGRTAASLSDTYYLLHENTGTLAASVGLLDRLLNDPAAGHDQGALYAALLDVVRAVELDKSQRLAAFERNEVTLRRAVTLAGQTLASPTLAGQRPAGPAPTRANTDPDPAFGLLLAWGSGVLGDRAELATLFTPLAQRLVTSSDPAQRLLASWALSRHAVYRPEAREAALAALLGEGDARVALLLGKLSNATGGPDLLQRLEGSGRLVEPSP